MFFGKMSHKNLTNLYYFNNIQMLQVLGFWHRKCLEGGQNNEC